MSKSTTTIGDAIKNRSSLHTLSADIQIEDTQVRGIVRDAILHSPTPFNCQSGRAVVLLKDEHHKFWDIAYQVVKASVPPPMFEKVFEPRIKMFLGAYGTILFYESTNVLKKIQEKMPILKEHVPQYSEHANGMLQYAVWTMLTAEGLGVNLQHYNPMVDTAVAKQWSIPEDWNLKAQMVFGKPAGPRLTTKEYEPAEDRMMVFGTLKED